MKPEEAIDYLKGLIIACDVGGDGKLGKSLFIAISAMKEVQEYRKIGTVEECREAVEAWNRRAGEQNES